MVGCPSQPRASTPSPKFWDPIRDGLIGAPLPDDDPGPLPEDRTLAGALQEFVHPLDHSWAGPQTKIKWSRRTDDLEAWYRGEIVRSRRRRSGPVETIRRPSLTNYTAKTLREKRRKFYGCGGDPSLGNRGLAPLMGDYDAHDDDLTLDDAMQAALIVREHLIAETGCGIVPVFASSDRGYRLIKGISYGDWHPMDVHRAFAQFIRGQRNLLHAYGSPLVTNIFQNCADVRGQPTFLRDDGGIFRGRLGSIPCGRPLRVPMQFSPDSSGEMPWAVAVEWIAAGLRETISIDVLADIGARWEAMYPEPPRSASSSSVQVPATPPVTWQQQQHLPQQQGPFAPPPGLQPLQQQGQQPAQQQGQQSQPQQQQPGVTRNHNARAAPSNPTSQSTGQTQQPQQPAAPATPPQSPAPTQPTQTRQQQTQPSAQSPAPTKSTDYVDVNGRQIFVGDLRADSDAFSRSFELAARIMRQVKDDRLLPDKDELSNIYEDVGLNTGDDDGDRTDRLGRARDSVVAGFDIRLCQPPRRLRFSEVLQHHQALVEQHYPNGRKCQSREASSPRYVGPVVLALTMAIAEWRGYRCPGRHRNDGGCPVKKYVKPLFEQHGIEWTGYIYERWVAARDQLEKDGLITVNHYFCQWKFDPTGEGVAKRITGITDQFPRAPEPQQPHEEPEDQAQHEQETSSDAAAADSPPAPPAAAAGTDGDSGTQEYDPCVVPDSLAKQIREGGVLAPELEILPSWLPGVDDINGNQSQQSSGTGGKGSSRGSNPVDTRSVFQFETNCRILEVGEFLSRLLEMDRPPP